MLRRHHHVATHRVEAVVHEGALHHRLLLLAGQVVVEAHLHPLGSGRAGAGHGGRLDSAEVPQYRVRAARHHNQPLLRALLRDPRELSLGEVGVVGFGNVRREQLQQAGGRHVLAHRLLEAGGDLPLSVAAGGRDDEDVGVRGSQDPLAIEAHIDGRDRRPQPREGRLGLGEGSVGVEADAAVEGSKSHVALPCGGHAAELALGRHRVVLASGVVEADVGLLHHSPGDAGVPAAQAVGVQAQESAAALHLSALKVRRDVRHRDVHAVLAEGPLRHHLLALEVHTEDGRLFGRVWRHEEHVGLAVGKESLLGGHHVALVIQLDVYTCFFECFPALVHVAIHLHPPVSDDEAVVQPSHLQLVGFGFIIVA
mmetsp:Transcript_21515/g.35989  ORF Transcript_21515/g.35989 Transcript_21515/m.35989 type:complete len:368 (+) Transcript_21515:187-1290(+)